MTFEAVGEEFVDCEDAETPAAEEVKKTHHKDARIGLHMGQDQRKDKNRSRRPARIRTTTRLALMHSELMHIKQWILLKRLYQKITSGD
ncbi:hypothetical protein AC480_04705 [miscellaneous Crenarchaeota group archaeon SMTZ1-55]|nr:MAG: hypothetical protein AC480_04705 [miscellaneous Crenarchaeota group archaeon SMTZ1-55]